MSELVIWRCDQCEYHNSGPICTHCWHVPEKIEADDIVEIRGETTVRKMTAETYSKIVESDTAVSADRQSTPEKNPYGSNRHARRRFEAEQRKTRKKR